jgi:hypothetical protein
MDIICLLVILGLFIASVGLTLAIGRLGGGS